MRNQIYRGIILNDIPKSDIKSTVNKSPNKDVCMNYRGNFYNKFFG